MSRQKRNPNFTNAEITILIEEVERRKDVLFSKHNSTVTNQAKKGEWDHICSKVNSVNTSYIRSAEELKKKWSAICSEGKKKFAKIKREQRKTGGGLLPADCTTTPLEEKIQSILGETSTSGVEGGMDTLVQSERDESNEVERKGGILTESVSTDQSLEVSTATTTVTATCSETSKPTSTCINAPTRKRKQDLQSPSLELVKIEKERLEIEKKRMELEAERLAVEQKRLSIEQGRLQIEQEKHNIKLCQLGIISNATVTPIQ
ncbi:myb/SANT-like DNA-binding domain-containing protein 4 [Saccostrea cucullata]|uniref:myb/SANT-like DNA-binding domain-containing protein 4 n=1 Tax=Saccostrea cuccullata TaxID=36930 RepID=UPI002ECFD025